MHLSYHTTPRFEGSRETSSPSVSCGLTVVIFSSFLCFKHFLSHFSRASIAVVTKGNRAYNRIVCKFASRFDRFPSERNTVQVKLHNLLFLCVFTSFHDFAATKDDFALHRQLSVRVSIFVVPISFHDAIRSVLQALKGVWFCEIRLR